MHDNAATERKAPPEPESVALVVYDGVATFEVGVASDVFGTGYAPDFGVPWYRLSICGATPSVVLDAGPRMEVPDGLAAVRTAGTVVVLPTRQPDQVPAAVLDELRAARARGQRIMSLCTGAFVLAAAGILDGHRATTHWGECAELARRYPAVTVDPDVLYVDEGDLLTSAGSAASIDLCLHVVQTDYGREVATRLARELVVPLYRDGGQAQFIDTPIPVLDDQHLFADTLAWLQSHLDELVTVRDLADRAAMSPRTFARRFLASTGLTPYQWIVRERIRLAQRLLETSDLPVDAIAVRTGFATAGNLRKHFGRTVRTSPHAYRDSFRAR
ncbi:MAG TPA: helix-turn-helix domain-containing protein [Streptosporangiaceae bacterium]|nr:helix-turn-helix domain-containing protein [Streptosporangiaceae bacterium]